MYRIAAAKPPGSNVRAAPSITAQRVRTLSTTGALVERIASLTVRDSEWHEYEFADKGRGWIRSDVHTWTEVTTETQFCDGFDSPVGNADERATSKVWPGGWFDASPFGQRNYNGLHPGADLNLNTPRWDSDKGMPLYAVASGRVITCGKFRVWGDLIVIQHDPLPDGQIVYSRYAHMDRVDAVTWQRVERGQQLGTIGNADTAEKPEGSMPYHLHFDIAVTDVLVNRPQHWPGFNAAELKRHYVDPKLWIETHHYAKYQGG